jgi:hypothetical protein
MAIHMNTKVNTDHLQICINEIAVLLSWFAQTFPFGIEMSL